MPENDDNTEILQEISNTLKHPITDIESVGVLNDIKESFNTQLGGLAESLKPSALLGVFGAEFSSPLIGMLGSKLSSVEDFVSSNLKNAFLQESKDDATAAREVESNNILAQIAENTGQTADITDEGSSILDIIKNPGQAIGLLVSSLTGGLMGGMLGKSGTIISKLFRGLGKMSLPIALLFGARDFIRGFKDVEKIAGTTNIVDAVEAGISQLLSSLTFGIISTKQIYNVIDFFENKIKEIMRAPLILLQGIIAGKTDFDVLIKNFITDIIGGITLGFLSKDKIKNAVKITIDSIKTIFNAPINFISDIMASEEGIDTIIKRNIIELLDAFTLGIFTKENINKNIEFVIEKINMLLTHPIILLEKIINSYTDFLDVPSFDITGFVDKIADEVTQYLDDVITSLQNFTDIIKDKILDKFDAITDFFTFKSTDNKLLNTNVFGEEPQQKIRTYVFGEEPQQKIQTNKRYSLLTDRLERLERPTKDIKLAKTTNNANIANITNNNNFTSTRNTDTKLLGVDIAMF